MVRLSWDSTGVLPSDYRDSSFLPEIEKQLDAHDWTQLPAEVSVGDYPDKTWTIFLPPGMPLSMWIKNQKADLVDFVIYMEEEYLDG